MAFTVFPTRGYLRASRHRSSARVISSPNSICTAAAPCFARPIQSARGSHNLFRAQTLPLFRSGFARSSVPGRIDSDSKRSSGCSVTAGQLVRPSAEPLPDLTGNQQKRAPAPGYEAKVVVDGPLPCRSDGGRFCDDDHPGGDDAGGNSGCGPGDGSGDQGDSSWPGSGWPGGGPDALMSGAVAYEVSGASRRNYSRSDDTGEIDVSRVNARETRGRLFEEVRLFFLPEGFPDSVGPSYAAYTFWRFVQNVISAMTAVLSTQALLSAVGIGPGAAQSVAAATSWVLKDGIGSVGKLITARMGVAFDSESKMYRLSSDILFDLGISLELLTPVFPQQFLLLAALGNFIKSVSITIGMACRNSVLATFVLRENLGDISAKNDAQNTIANLLGLAGGIGVARVLPDKTSVRLAAFWALTSVYSLLNYQSMKAVTLQTLNRQRAGIAIDEFIRGNPIPSPHYTNQHERILPFIKPRFAEPRLRLGAPLSSLEDGLEPMVAIAKKQGNRFIIDLSPNAVNVVLHRDATSDDMLEAYLAYSYIRRVLGDRLNDGLCRGVGMFAERRKRCVPTAHRIWTSIDPANRYKKLEESRQYARKNFRRLKQALSEAGYNTKILLFAPDRVRAVY
jgi:hypothetical protein